jgi:hypothetical protein
VLATGTLRPMAAIAARVRPLMADGRPDLGAASFIGAVALLVGAIALAVNRVHNGDVYLELSAGRLISQHGLVAHDPFSTIAVGREWLNQQWLSELAFYKVARAVGMTGLTVLYAVALGLPLVWLLWRCRTKGLAMLVAGSVLYLPTILGIVHPRAAVFTLAGFSVLLVLLLRGWPSTLAIPALFALWANLHGGFVAGLLLIAVVGAGTLLERLRDRRAAGHSATVPWRAALRGPGLLGLIGVGAFAATFLTPLGPRVWAYVWSFRNPSLSVATDEWGSALHSPAVLVYLVVAALFAAWLWRATPSPRPITPPLVVVSFLALALVAQRNVLLLGPVMLYLIARCAPDRPEPRRWRGPVALVGTAAAAAAALWAFALGPARTAPYLKPDLVSYVLSHPPADGRIASVAGIGSYMLWRSSGTPVVINGWLEHYTPGELRGAYDVLRPHPVGLGYIQRWGVGGVITHSPWTVRWLVRHGFRVALASHEGTYLVRSGPLTGAPTPPG